MEDEGTVERVLLPDLDAHAGPQPEGVEEGDDVGVGRAGHGDIGDVAGLEGVQRRQPGMLGHLGRRDREAVGAGGGRSRAMNSRSSTSWGSSCSKLPASRSASFQA